jgi:hypothetical protein
MSFENPDSEKPTSTSRLDGDAFRKSIMELGFLSPAVHQTIDGIRRRNAAIFDLADDASRLGQEVMFHGISVGARETTMSPIGLGTQLLIRTVSNFQAAVILAERGMTIEARTLVRSCYENAVFIGGLHTCPKETVDHMRADERGSQIGRLTIMAEEMEAEGHDPVEVSRLRGRIEEISATPEPVRLSTRLIAKRVGINAHYLFFRQMSADSAHPSLSALQKHLEMENGEPLGFGIGQDFNGVQTTMEIASHAFISGVAFYGRLIGDDAASERADMLHARLIEIAMPESAS